MAKALREIPSYTFGTYDSAPMLKSVLREHENGILGRSAQLVQAMMRDDRYAGVMRTRIMGLLGTPLEMEPRGDGRRKKAVSEEALETWDTMFPESELFRQLFFGINLGISFAENLVDTSSVAGRWLPRIKVWDPSNAHYDQDRRVWLMATRDGEVEIQPDDPRWSIYAPYGLEGGWMNGLVRSVATTWQFRQWTIRDWARYSEVHGNPIKLAITPEAADVEEKERWHRQVANPGAESTYRVTQGEDGRKFDLQFREPSGTSHESFAKQLDRLDSSLSIAVLGHNLTSEVKGGSFAAAKVGDVIRGDIREFDAQTLSTALRNGTLKRWAKWNFDDAELAPSPTWDTEPPADLKSNAETMAAVGLGFTNLRNGGLDPDREKIADEFGIPYLRTVEPVQQTAPGAGSPNGNPDDADVADEGEPTDEGDAPPADEPKMAPTQKPAAASRGKKMKPSGVAKQIAGAVKAQTHNDNLTDDHIAAGKVALGKTLALVDREIEAATDPADLRKRLIRIFAHLDRDKLETLIESSIIRAELNGALAVIESNT